MRKTSFLLCLLFTSPLWATPPAGKIIHLAGKVKITHVGKKPVSASINQAIFLGDILETKSDGSAKILFLDDTHLILKENSKVFISEFLFDPKARRRKIIFNAPFGTIRTVVSRSFGKDQRVEIQTPIAVSGIRGTDIGARIKPKATTFYCFFCKKGVVRITNTLFPKQPIFLTTGQSIKVMEGKPTLKKDVLPIPQDILEKKETLFDLQLVPDIVNPKEKEEEIIQSIPGPFNSDTPINPGGTPENKPDAPGGAGPGKM